MFGTQRLSTRFRAIRILSNCIYIFPIKKTLLSGHCCHRLLKKGDVTKPVCVLHRLTEKEACVDGCQCSSHLNCFLPDAVESQNATVRLQLAVHVVSLKASESEVSISGSVLQKGLFVRYSRRIVSVQEGLGDRRQRFDLNNNDFPSCRGASPSDP